MTIANFMHYGVGAMALIKTIFGAEENIELIITLTLVYSIFALYFAYLFMNNPKSISKTD